MIDTILEEPHNKDKKQNIDEKVTAILLKTRTETLF
jgi:hypothetical protein